MKNRKSIMVKKLLFVLLIAGLNYPGHAQISEIGHWSWDEMALPVFTYTGKIPYNYIAPDGQKINLPSDPWFLLGNYKLTSFIYTSGIYDLYCNERVWGKLNDAQKTKAFITVNKKKYDITGINSKYACNAKKEFGTGFAKFVYDLPEDIEVTRVISVAPSEKINSGQGALFFNIYIKNKGKKNIEIEYAEQVNGRYNQISQRPWISYPARGTMPQQGLSKISFSANATYGILPAIDEPSLVDVYSPVLYQFSD